MWEAIIGILGSLASTLLNKHMNDQSVEKMNDYNSPKSQLARYSEAGLSPANVYSQGAGSGTQNLIGNYQTSLGSDIVNSVMGASQLRQQKQLLKHQMDLIDSEAALNEAKTLEQMLRNPYITRDMKASIQEKLAHSFNLNATGELAQHQGEYYDVLSDLTRTQNLHEFKKIGVTTATIEQVYATIENIEALTGSINYDTTTLKPKQVEEMDAHIKQLGALADEAISQANLNDEIRKHYENFINKQIDELTARAAQENSQSDLNSALRRTQENIRDEMDSRRDLNDTERDLLLQYGKWKYVQNAWQQFQSAMDSGTYDYKDFKNDPKYKPHGHRHKNSNNPNYSGSGGKW